jgi:outer membrane beta-barrel protein
MLSLVMAALIGTASAQETVDVGVVTANEMRVVQNNLYPKAGRTELAMALGWMPFDTLLTTPNAQLAFDVHQSENLAFGAVVGGGYGLKNGDYHELEGPRYGVAPDAYRYLASAIGGVEWSPIYAKANLNGARIVHYDVYGAGRAGVSLEQSVIPQGGIAIAPTISLAAGSRFFLAKNGAIRVELRDDFLIEHRKLTQTTYLKQNVDVTIGYSILSPVKEKK